MGRSYCVQRLHLQLLRNFFQSLCQGKGDVVLAGQSGVPRQEQRKFTPNWNMAISSSFTRNFQIWPLNKQRCQRRAA